MEGLILLNYKSVSLRKSDIQCLDNYKYLNDLCISFYYEILTQKFSKHEKDFFLFDPSSISIILFDDNLEDLKECFNPLNLPDKNFLFIPVNDISDKYSYGGGNHWGLIFYLKSSNIYYYIDSMKSYIKNIKIICEKINYLVGNSNKPNIQEANTIKLQENTYDCGVFLLKFTEIILENIYIHNNTYNNLIKLNDYGTEVDFCCIINKSNCSQNIISIERKSIKDLVYSMIKYT